jgi:biotin synthase
MDIDNLKRLAKAGADRIGIPLDAATEELFDKIKGKSTGGPYVWKKQFELLREAVAVFGKGKVSTHFIVGLGETEKEMIKVVQRCVDMGVLPALFAFTPIEGTALRNMPQPPVQAYRRMQIAQSLVVSGLARAEKMRFDEKGRLADYGTGRQTLRRLIESGEPFRTSGCSDCNRPYYNEKPSGPIYNYPRKLEQGEIEEIRKQISPDGA